MKKQHEVPFMFHNRPFNVGLTDDIAPTITSECGKMPGMTLVQRKVIAIDQQGGKGNASFSVDIAPTLCSDSHGTPHAVAYGLDGYNSSIAKQIHPTIGVNCGMSTGRGGVVIQNDVGN